jgi:hypothetical protein
METLVCLLVQTVGMATTCGMLALSSYVPVFNDPAIIVDVSATDITVDEHPAPDLGLALDRAAAVRRGVLSAHRELVLVVLSASAPLSALSEVRETARAHGFFFVVFRQRAPWLEANGGN